MQATGKILRFDETRGYGFIVPDHGDEDVFVHANDLLEEKHAYQSGRAVEFFVEMGEKGPKASEVRLIRGASTSFTPPPATAAAPSASRVAKPSPQAMDDTLCDVLSVAELRSELTELLLEADDTLTARQIRQVRSRFLELARAHSWTDA